ncbi:MAG: hypothetical protein JSR55_13625 [Proteobacteria bacterium]|nr:hypothetical protein [Pseudomonadota bacterium]
MAVTAVLSEDGSAAVVSGGNDNDGFSGHRFSWSAAFAGAILATAVMFFLLALGSGFGLALTPAQPAATPTFLSLGAIYFFVAQAFGFAAGGHLAGRLIGPAPETAKEEEFRSAAHGLVVWALTVVAAATLIAIGSLAAGGSAVAVAASSNKFGAQSSTMTNDYVAYWVDMLFRPGPSPSQAALDWAKYAQANTGNATDATPQPETANPPAATPSPDLPESTQPSGAGQSTPQTAPPSSVTIGSGSPAPASPPLPNRLAPKDTFIPPAPAGFAPPASLNADKAEAARIIKIGMANGARMNQYDKDRLAALVAQDTGMALPGAQRRVDNAEMRMHNDTVRAAETARKIASYASLWIAASLLFGAIVAAAAAMSARWEDDTITFGWPRREPGRISQN